MNDIKDKFTNLSSAFLYVSIIILFALFVFTVQSIISPIVVFIILVLTLLPFRDVKFLNVIFWISIFLFIIWIFNELGNILAPFIIAYLIAYLLDPLIDRLQKKNLSRGLSIATIFSTAIVLIGLIIIFIVPPFFEQITKLVASVPDFTKNFQYWIENDLLATLEKIGFPRENIETYIFSNISSKMESILTSIFEGFINIFGSIGTVLSQIVNIIIIPILTFYILKDFGFINSNIKRLFKKKSQLIIENYATKVDKIVGSYIRGASIVCLINGIVITTLLTLVGVKYSFVLGILSAVFCFIPYFGVLISFAIGFIVALFSELSTLSLILIPIIYFGENLLETSVFYPKIIGARIGMHPVMLILSLFVFSYFFGLVGMLIAVPVTSIVLMIMKENLEKGEQDSPESFFKEN